MNEELIKEIIAEIKVRCPNAQLSEGKYHYVITLGAGASSEQIRYICRWSDFSGIDVRVGKLTVTFDK